MKKSAGIILYRHTDKLLEVLLVHPGGPFWKNKDDGAWSIPKGEFGDDENALDAAKREMLEETGFTCAGTFVELTPIKQKSGKLVYAWAVEQDVDAAAIISNSFEMEWPPKSGKIKSFPEIDKAQWFTPAEARQKINASQSAFIDELVFLLDQK